MRETIFRFVIGSIAVSAFATLGDVLKPKSFAGLFGAAPSVAIATLALAISAQGSGYAAIEASSMAIGAIAFLVYACFVALVLRRFRVSVVATAGLLLSAWFVAAFGLSAAWQAVNQ